MKIVVINLESRKDRLQFMSDQLQGHTWNRFNALNGHNLELGDFKNLNFFPFVNWKDPLLGRPHTNTDLAAMISHFRVWEMCANDSEPYLILEDDAELVGQLDLNHISLLLNSYDVVYLDYKEMKPDEIKFIGNDLFIPYYPYWNSAYALSPQSAKKIINSEYRYNLVPVDEFFPLLYDVDYDKHCLSDDITIKENFKSLQRLFKKDFTLKPIAYKSKVFRQKSRSELGSDIERGKKMTIDTNVHLLTVATDESRLNYLKKSKNNIFSKFVNLGKGKQWTGGDMTKPGGGMKVNLLKDYISSLNNNDIVVFCDGYDVFINDDLDTIIERFKGFNCDVAFGAEKSCWPDQSMAEWFPKGDTEYNFLNSGVFIGTVKGIKKLTLTSINDSDDDQLYFQKQFIRSKMDGTLNVFLDRENYLFQCLAGAEKELMINRNGQLLNVATRCCPCILHGNGGNSTKNKFDELVTKLTNSPLPVISSSDSYFIQTTDYQEHDTDILVMDFMTPENCQKLIQMAEKNGQWQSMYGDKFPGQEIRIREFSMDYWNKLEDHFKNYINPAIEKHWFPLQMYGLRDAFIIKYDQNTQSNLKCHHDASLVSGLVKLNDGYSDGDTYFYRQNYSNINIPVGKIILWPGQVTHGHEGRTVTSGIKYNLVIWTSRHRNDINY